MTVAATLTLTFDNLGEAADLERGLWPPDRPIGRHPSVTQALPALLAVLAQESLHATFFVEASNVAIYPDAIAAIVAGGHEVGHHGWRHEPWATLPAPREEELLRRGVEAFADAGILVRGFRPPGGELTAATPSLLRSTGLRWCSPVADEAPHVDDGLAVIPFRWPLVDAYHLASHFHALRLRHGDPSLPVAPEAMVDRIVGELDALGDTGGQRTLILHPFLSVDPLTLTAVTRLLRAIGERVRAGDLDVGPGGPLAAALLTGAAL
ncbi:MAG: polysaccharide deacetylase [Solirubrobacterales bacterium]|jgi:peptidoglycan/xylan/chitin deacetylase (PgdA/CDA1 family)|nr:polysaccharide deacetylase [Solirubrobacterales bacterium]